jgi:hypothetical protein
MSMKDTGAEGYGLPLGSGSSHCLTAEIQETIKPASCSELQVIPKNIPWSEKQ